MKNTYFLFILALLLFQYACNESGQPQEDLIEVSEDSGKIIITEEQFNASEYELGKPTKRSFNTHIAVNGMVDLPMKNKSKVSSYFGGIVNDMALIHGQWVNKGQTLFSLTNPELVNHQQEFLELKGQIKYLESEFERQKKLSEEKISANKDFLKAESELQITRTKISGIAQKLKLFGLEPEQLDLDHIIATLTVKAPISGYVTELNIVNGDFLQPTISALEISNTAHLHLELKVLEKDINKIKVGQKVTYSIQSDPSKKYDGKIYLIDKMVEDSRLINVHTHIEDPEPENITSGMFVSAWIETDQVHNYSLPEEAIINLEGKEYILIEESAGSYTFVSILVETGIKQNGYVEILNKIDTTSNYLIKGGYYVLM